MAEARRPMRSVNVLESPVLRNVVGEGARG